MSVLPDSSTVLHVEVIGLSSNPDLRESSDIAQGIRDILTIACLGYLKKMGVKFARFNSVLVMDFNRFLPGLYWNKVS